MRRFNKAIREAIGLDNLLTIIDPPTLESAAALFDHKAFGCWWSPAGRPSRGRPSASKKRAIVAGPGNPPVVVDATACLENAAKSIVAGGAFDNNLLCIGEKQVFAVAEIFDTLMEAMTPPRRLPAHAIADRCPDQGGVRQRGATVRCTSTRISSARTRPCSAGTPASRFPQGTQILFGETGAEHPFVEHEQMMPFVPFVRVSNVDRAIALAKESEHGYGHTAILHSRDTSVMSKMGKIMDCTIFVVNGPCTAGLGWAAKAFCRSRSPARPAKASPRH